MYFICRTSLYTQLIVIIQVVTMHSRDTSSLLSAGHAVNQTLSRWASPLISAKFDEALLRCLGDDSARPLTPAELIGLVQTGHFQEAAYGLGFIIRPHELRARWLSLHPDDTAPSVETLTRVAASTTDLPLSQAERSVIAMLHAITTTGLDSSMHPSERALDLLRPYIDKLNVDLVPSFGSGQNEYSYRVLGAASLLAAQTSKIASAQPCGVQILRAAYKYGYPCLLITSHHSLGGDAVPLIAEHCKREGLLNGEISSPRLGFVSEHPDIFWIHKEDVNAWRDGFERLAELELKLGHSILVVEDSLGTVFNGRALSIEDTIRTAHEQCPSLRLNPLIIVRDCDAALATLRSTPIAGVMTDLFIPTTYDSPDKSCGEVTVREVLGRFLLGSEIDTLLCEGRCIESQIEELMEHELELLLQLS